MRGSSHLQAGGGERCGVRLALLAGCSASSSGAGERSGVPNLPLPLLLRRCCFRSGLRLLLLLLLRSSRLPPPLSALPPLPSLLCLLPLLPAGCTPCSLAARSARARCAAVAAPGCARSSRCTSSRMGLRKMHRPNTCAGGTTWLLLHAQTENSDTVGCTPTARTWQKCTAAFPTKTYLSVLQLLNGMRGLGSGGHGQVCDVATRVPCPHSPRHNCRPGRARRQRGCIQLCQRAQGLRAAQPATESATAHMLWSPHIMLHARIAGQPGASALCEITCGACLLQQLCEGPKYRLLVQRFKSTAWVAAKQAHVLVAKQRQEGAAHRGSSTEAALQRCGTVAAAAWQTLAQQPHLTKMSEEHRLHPTRPERCRTQTGTSGASLGRRAVASLGVRLRGGVRSRLRPRRLLLFSLPPSAARPLMRLRLRPLPRCAPLSLLPSKLELRQRPARASASACSAAAATRGCRIKASTSLSSQRRKSRDPSICSAAQRHGADSQQHARLPVSRCGTARSQRGFRRHRVRCPLTPASQAPPAA